MDVYDLISDKLDEIYEAVNNDPKGTKIPDDFVYAYGPLMCMKQNAYEVDCDKLSKYNPTLKMMVHAAYLIRSIMNGLSYRTAKELIKQFNIQVSDAFPDNELERNTLYKLSGDYLKRIREEQKEKGELESFMTCASPIVPYGQQIKRADALDSTEESVRVDIYDQLDKYKDCNIEEKVRNLLHENLPEILLNFDLCTCMGKDCDNNDINILNDMARRKDNVSIPVQLYYTLATLNYYKLNKSDKYATYVDFNNKIGDFSKTQNYSTFESYIVTMSKFVNPVMESLDDPSLDYKEDEMIRRIIEEYNQSINDEPDLPRYDFHELDDFLAVKRYMKFDTYANRLFMGSIEHSSIVNINNMGKDRNYYEMNNGTVVCPFVDLRDYKVKAAVLHEYTNEIEIVSDFAGMY